MNEERVKLVVEGNVAHLRLNRPAARNAIDAPMVEALEEAIMTVAERPDLRALLISGEGPSFCVGGDLKYFSERLDTLPAEFHSMIGRWHRVLPVLASLRIPVITAVHGGTAGGGLGLVWCADFVLAAENTTIATGFVELGVPGDGGSSWHLPRLVGLRRAQEMLLDNRVLDAKTALAWGLVTEVVPLDELMPKATATAQRLAARSLTAYGHIKDRLLESLSSTYADHLAREQRAMEHAAAQPDVRAGMPAFVGKRKPTFVDPVRR